MKLRHKPQTRVNSTHFRAVSLPCRATIGPSYGYYANATKTWLVVKDTHLASATLAFLGTNVNITSEGRPHLGAPLGTETYVAQSCKVVPTTADLMFNCNHSTTCDFCSLYSQCGSPMDLPCQDRSKHKQIFYTHGRHNKVKPYPHPLLVELLLVTSSDSFCPCLQD